MFIAIFYEKRLRSRLNLSVRHNFPVIGQKKEIPAVEKELKLEDKVAFSADNDNDKEYFTVSKIVLAQLLANATSQETELFYLRNQLQSLKKHIDAEAPKPVITFQDLIRAEADNQYNLDRGRIRSVVTQQPDQPVESCFLKAGADSDVARHDQVDSRSLETASCALKFSSSAIDTTGQFRKYLDRT